MSGEKTRKAPETLKAPIRESISDCGMYGVRIEVHTLKEAAVAHDVFSRYSGSMPLAFSNECEESAEGYLKVFVSGPKEAETSKVVGIIDRIASEIEKEIKNSRELDNCIEKDLYFRVFDIVRDTASKSIAERGIAYLVKGHSVTVKSISTGEIPCKLLELKEIAGAALRANLQSKGGL
jgi:hypothetical protein